MGFPGGSEGKESACNAGDPGSIPRSGSTPEKEMATYSSTLAWKIPCMEKPGRLQSTGSQKVRQDWTTTLSKSQTGLSHFTFTFSPFTWWTMEMGVRKQLHREILLFLFFNEWFEHGFSIQPIWRSSAWLVDTCLNLSVFSWSIWRSSKHSGRLWHRSTYFLVLPLVFLFSHSVMSDSLQPHVLQHARLPCPSLSPGVCSNSCPLSWWCHAAISFSVALFSSCSQSFPASASFPISCLLASGGQNIGASESVLPMKFHLWSLCQLHLYSFRSISDGPGLYLPNIALLFSILFRGSVFLGTLAMLVATKSVFLSSLENWGYLF